MWGTWVQSLGGEDPLEKEMVTHSSTLAWKTPWMEKPGRLQSMGSQRVGHDRATSISLFPSFIARIPFPLIFIKYFFPRKVRIREKVFKQNLDNTGALKVPQFYKVLLNFSCNQEAYKNPDTPFRIKPVLRRAKQRDPILTWE